MMLKVKNAMDMERTESRFKTLKECDSEFLVSYLDLVRKDDELWVGIPWSIN